MKKSLLALAVLGAFAGVASAQSSVTLFGVVDVNARYVDQGGRSVSSLSTDGINSSRLGFRGVEDLGGGLKAGFWLEAGINPDTGTTTTTSANNGAIAGTANGGTTYSKLFNRRSTVSLLGGFGELRLGRDYTPTFWNLTIFDPFGTNGVGGLLNIVGGPSFSSSGNSTLIRADNSIGYFLPAGLGGLYGQFMVAAGEGQQVGNSNSAANPTLYGNKHMSGRIGWGAGPFDVAFAYGENTDIPVGTGTESFKVWNLGGSWDFGFAKFTGQYMEAEFLSAKNKVYQAGVIVPLGAGEIHASYSANDGSGKTYAENSNNGRQYAVGYVYNLSKRTAVYTTYSQIDNDPGANYGVAGNPSMAGRAGQDSTGYEIGLRHSF